MRAANSLALAVLLLPGFACEAQSQAEEPFQISVNLNLVVLQAAVHDRNGRFAPDLHEGDFAVYEDGVRQSIRLFRHEDIPVTVGLVVDHSGSMRPKLPWVIAAARTFVASSSAQDQMFVVNFNEKVTFGLPGAVRLSDRPDELARAISSQPTTGKTALYDAVAAAFTGFGAGGPDKKVLIVISDGGDNASAHTLAEVLKTAEESSALIYTIGIFDEDDKDRNPDVLRRLARATGGEAYFPPEFDRVVSICENIAHDIRNQYTIGYVSNNAEKPGALRSIRVTAQAAGHGKLLVRTRSGYIAGAASP
ncbi:MAG: VWA domain-containing protein [Bryobacteraceae bacterium]|jgi:VWFA-related protein